MAFVDKYANFDLATGLNDGSSEANAWQTPADVIANVAAGNRVNIKKQASDYDLQSEPNFNVSGTATSPIHYRAYETTPGDGGIWSAAYNSDALASLLFTGDYCFVEGIELKPGTATSGGHNFRVQGLGSVAIRCKAQLLHGAGAIIAYNSVDCDFTMGVNDKMTLAHTNAQHNSHSRSRFTRVGTSNPGSLITADMFGAALVFDRCSFVGNGNANENCIFFDRAADGRGVFAFGNRFYNFDSALVFDEEPDHPREPAWIIANVFSNMAAYAVERTNVEAGFVRMFQNYYYSMGTAFSNYSDEAQIGNVALSAAPFSDPGNGNLELNSTTNGGQVLRDLIQYVDPTASSGMRVVPYGHMFVPTAGSGGGGPLTGGRLVN